MVPVIAGTNMGMILDGEDPYAVSSAKELSTANLAVAMVCAFQMETANALMDTEVTAVNSPAQASYRTPIHSMQMILQKCSFVREGETACLLRALQQLAIVYLVT